MKDKKLFIIAIVLVLSIARISTMKGIENIRTVDFLYIFAIGALSGILLISLANKFKNRS